jgi:hypothetical protein
MGLIRDDRQGGLNKTKLGRALAKSSGGGKKVEQRISPPGFAQGNALKAVPGPAPFKAHWEPLHVSLAARGGAMLQRQNPAQAFDAKNHPRLHAPLKKFEKAAILQTIRMKSLADAEAGNASLRPVSPEFRAQSDANAPPVDTGKLIAMQTPQLAGLPPVNTAAKMLNNNILTKAAQQGAEEFQNSLPGAMYAGQAYLKDLNKTGNPIRSGINVFGPMAAESLHHSAVALRHPGRYPFDAATTAFPLFSAASRGAEIGSAAARGESISKAAAMAKPRILTGPVNAAGDVESVQALRSGSAGGRVLQRLHDKAFGLDVKGVTDVLTMSKANMNALARQAGIQDPQLIPRAELAQQVIQHFQGAYKSTVAQDLLTPYVRGRLKSERAQNMIGGKSIDYTIDPDLQPEGQAPGKVARAADLVNASGRLGQLYLKPAYLWANLLGQAGLTAAQQGGHVFANAKSAFSLHQAMKRTQGGSETLEIIHRALSGGQKRGGITGSVLGNQNFEGLSKVEKGVLGTEKAVSTLYGKALDDPWRFTAFVHEAKRLGYKTPQALYTLTHDPTKYLDFTQIQRRANRAMIDYSRMNRGERNIARRAVYFYPWIKGATMYGAQMPFEHPYLTKATSDLGRQGKQETEKRLGDNEIPSFMQGFFVSGKRNVPGLGNIPKGRNLAAASIFGTPAGVSQALFGGGGKEAVGQTFSDFPAPALQALARGAFHYDISKAQHYAAPYSLTSPLTEAGKGVVQGSFANRIMNDLPKKYGRKDQTDLLYPGRKEDIVGTGKAHGLLDRLGKVLGSYVVQGPAQSRPINPYVRRSQYRNEVTGALSDKGDRDKLKIGKWLPEDLVRETNKIREQHGMPALSAKQQLQLHHMVDQKLQLKLVYDEFKVPGGGKMKPVDRLQALAEYGARKAGKAHQEDGKWVYPKELEGLIEKLRDPKLPPATKDKIIHSLISPLEEGLFPPGALRTRS